MSETSEERDAGNRDQYLLESVVRACDILKLFPAGESVLRLKDIAAACGLNKTVAFRLVRTLEHSGLLKRSGKGYCSAIRFAGESTIKLGYAGQTSDSPFSNAVTESVRLAAAREGLDLVVLDNRYSAKVALRNAEELIRERVHVAIDFQTFAQVAPEISARFREARIPLISVELPHPGATYYGADNYQTGVTAGRALARWARQHWGGQVDQVLLLEYAAAGPIPQLRLTGIETGIRAVLKTCDARVLHLDTRGEFARAMDVVRVHLRRAPLRRTLIGAVNDPSVLGALRAFEEAGQLNECAAAGLGAILEARQELRQPCTRLIGSVAFFPEKYGSDLIRLALDILNQKHHPPAVYAGHKLITAANVNNYYPGDGAGGPEDSMHYGLLSSSLR